MQSFFKKILIPVIIGFLLSGMGFDLTTQVMAKEVIVWKMATKMPPESPEGKAFQLFADKVKEKSEGRMRIDVYPSEQLGKTEAVIEMVRAGTVHVYPEGIGYLERFIPAYGTVNLPFVFENRAHWKRFVQSPRVKKWEERLRREYGIRLLGDPAAFVRGPYRVLVSKKPILSVEDVQGLKLRMYPNDTVIAVWQKLGADCIMLAWTEIYESLQRGLVEACTSPVALVDAMKFQEVAKYILRTNEFPQGMAFMTNNKAFESLPSDLQQAVLEAHKEASEFSAKIMSEAAEESIERMIERDGVTFIRAPMAPWRKKVRPLYEKWEEEKRIPQGIIEYIEKLK